MLIALAASVLAAEPAERVAGIGLDLAALHTSARHDLVPAVDIFVAQAARPWGIVGELDLARQVDAGGDLYRFHTLSARVSVVPGLAIGTHATTFELGLGPALTARWTLADPDTSAVRLSPGVRGRVGLQGPLGERYRWSWHTAVTSRGPGVDYDVGLGLGLPL